MTSLQSASTALVGLVLAAAASLLAIGCGGSNGDSASAEVTIDTVDPSPTYKGVETTIAFTIEPGNGVSKSDVKWRVDFGDTNTSSGEGASGEVVHVWKESGNYSLEVSARSGGSTVGSASRKIDVSGPVDLAVSNIQGRPANVQTGDQLSVQFDVTNNSANPVESDFEASVFLRPEDDASVTAEELANDDPHGTGEVTAEEGPVVEAEGKRRATVTVTVPEEFSSGNYLMIPWIRPAGQLADTDESNNFAVSSSTIRVDSAGGLLPDVDVDDVFVIPDRAFPALNEFQRGFTLANKGDTDAAGVTTETFLSVGDKKIDQNDRKVHTSENPVDVPAGSSEEIGPDQIVLSDDIKPMNGPKKVYVIVRASLDANDKEATKENNVGISDPPITVTDKRADGPDIVVEKFSVTPETTYVGGTLEVSAKITNQGNADVSSFPCRLYLGDSSRVDIQNDEFFNSLNVTGLNSGKSKSIQRSMRVTGARISPGTYHVYMYCDPNGALDETFRGNNARLHPNPVEITQDPNVDMQIASLKAPKTVQDGNDLTVTAEICVSGKNASGPTRGELYETIGKQVDFSKDPKQTFSIPNINPGECDKVDVKFEADCADFEETYSYGVKIDTNDTLNENNENNNQATASNNTEIQGRYCSCQEDNWEQNDRARTSATLMSAGKKSAGLCTAGECDYYDISLSKKESLRVETTFPADKGSLETTMYDPSGLTVLDEDTNAGRQRVATFSVPTSDDYIFSVCGATSSSRNLYDMDIDILSQPSGIDLIPRKVELPAQTTYSIGATISADLRIHNIGDKKSGSFEVEYVITPDRKVDNGNDVPLKPSTINVGSINPASQADTKTDLEIPASSLMKGDFYIAATVDPTGQINEAETANNVSFSKQITLQTRCYDPLEPNDKFSTATDVQSRSYSNLTACASEEDYYRLCTKDGKKFDVTVNYKPQMGDVDLELYDRNQQRIDASATTGNGKEEVSVSYVNGAQCYYIRPYLLTQQSMASTSYDMTVQVQDVPQSLQCSSYFEPNDSFSAASSLIPALQQSQSGTIDRCPDNDDDYYRLQLSQNQTVTLSGTISPTSQTGTLRLQLYKPNQQPAKSVATAPGDATVKIKNYTAPTAGTYFLQVTLTGSKRNLTYKLGANGLGGIDLQADNIGGYATAKTYKAGETLTVQFDISNLRSDTATKPSYTVYLGDSSTLDRQNDTQLATGTLGQDVQGNTTVTDYEGVTIPQNPPSGTGYIHVEVEPDSSQTDKNPSNDVGTATISLQ